MEKGSALLYPPAQKLVEACDSMRARFGEEDERGSKIHVSEVVSRAARLYEWLRTSLEYKEEHLIRHSAIERILRRYIFLRTNATGRDLAESLLRELVFAGYFPNDTIPERAIDEAGEILDRYLAATSLFDEAETSHINFLLQLASIEIEHQLAWEEKFVEESFILFAYTVLKERVEWIGYPGGAEHEAQLFIAAHRAFLRSDDATISYTLFTALLPQWSSLSSGETRAKKEEIVRLHRAIHSKLKSARQEVYLRAVRQFVPAFTILHDALMSNTREIRKIFSERRFFLDVVEFAIEKRLDTIRERLRRSAIHATLYVFFTKMLVAFAIEIPYDKIVAKSFLWLPFFVNLLFPPALMFASAITATVPGPRNSAKILGDAEKIVFPDSQTPMLAVVELKRRRPMIRTFLLALLSLGIAALTFWGIIRVLQHLDFSAFNIGVFIFFLCVVSLFAFRIQQPARELVAVKRRETLLETALEIVAFPLLFVGRLISDQIARFNISLFLIDFIIEAPFKLLLEVGEDWVNFIREKREEIR